MWKRNTQPAVAMLYLLRILSFAYFWLVFLCNDQDCATASFARVKLFTNIPTLSWTEVTLNSAHQQKKYIYYNDWKIALSYFFFKSILYL